MLNTKVEQILLLAIIFLSFTAKAQTANSNASTETKQIFLFLQGLKDKPSKKIISGHMTNSMLAVETSYDSSVSKIYSKTGKWVGLLGIDYQRTALGYPTKINECNQMAVDYYRKGGLVTVMSSFSNPWTTTGNSNDTTGKSNLLQIITPGNSAYQKFHSQLDSVAKGIAQLRDSNVTVLYRPFHEHNAPWFWWGSLSISKPTKKDWDSLWVYVFNYFTKSKLLNNILWVFSPSPKTAVISNPAFKSEDYYYPGNQYVDIVGFDIYNDTLEIPLYSKLKSFGKPMALCEFGMQLERARTSYSYDYRTMLQQIKSKYPEIVYWMSWNDFGGPKGNVYYGMTNQKFVQELLNDPWVMNRGEMKWGFSTSVKNSIPSSYLLSQNYPNPFNPSTTINYQISSYCHVRLKVLDILGREVAMLVDEYKQPGSYSSQFKIQSSQLSSGVYFYQFQAGGFIQLKKMILIK